MTDKMKMMTLLLLLVSTSTFGFSPPLPHSRRTLPCLEAHSRTQFLSASAASFLSLIALSSPALALSTDEARKQLEAAIGVTDKLLEEWDTISAGGGDAIRTQLGTQGITSPLFQINKAVKVLQQEASDPVAFAEAAEEFLLGLGRADSMAYSANFAGGSGKPTPPKVYIDKSKVEVKELRQREREMMEAL